MAKTKIDRFGRVLIPKEIRQKIGISENSELEIELKDGKIVLSPANRSLEEKVEVAVNFLKEKAPKPFVSEEEVEEKWFTEDYSRRKIGLKE